MDEIEDILEASQCSDAEKDTLRSENFLALAEIKVIEANIEYLQVKA